MTAFDTLLKDVLPSAKGCPNPIAIDALRDAARELCECAALWRGEIDRVMYVAKQAEYDLAPPTDTEIVQVLEVYQDGHGPLLPKTSIELTRADARWSERTARQPAYYIHPTVDVLRLVPTPEISATVPIVVTGWLQPSLSATGMDDKLLAKWRDHIVMGAKARLLSVPGVAWSDPNMAGYHAQRFEAAKARAKGAVLSQFSGAGLRVATRALGG